MSENIVHEELEEGEIADEELPVSPKFLVQRNKVLPRRYILHENKRLSYKHKRNCKHADHHRHRKISTKLDQSSEKVGDSLKKHHKSCPHRSAALDNFKLQHNHTKRTKTKSHLSVKTKAHYHNFLQSKAKSAFKNYQSPPRTVRKILKQDCDDLRSLSNTRSCLPKLPDCKNFQADLRTIKNVNGCLKGEPGQIEPLLQNSGTNWYSDMREIETVQLKQNPQNFSLDSAAKLCDVESEDEEELRRIALSSCFRRTATFDTSVNKDVKVDASKINSESLLSQSPPLQVVKYNIPSSDNYDIVDMEVDEDNQNCEEEQSADNCLFIIDTTPSYPMEDIEDVSANSSNTSHVLKTPPPSSYQLDEDLEVELSATSFPSEYNENVSTTSCNISRMLKRSPPSSHQLDEDFEVQLLRAELIASMNTNRQKPRSNCDIFQKSQNLQDTSNSSAVEDSPKPHCVDSRNVMEHPSKICTNISDAMEHPKELSAVSDVEKTNTFCKTYSDNTSSSIHKTILKSDVLLKIKKDPIKQTENSKISTTVIATKPSDVSVSQNRIIISLNNESSTEESESETDEMPVLPDKVAEASLQALITNARYNSNESKSLSNNTNGSKAVSCLSKAQQAEYNSLVKILAEKEKKLQPSQLQNKNAVHSPLGDLKLLEKKLVIAKARLVEEKQQLNNVTKKMKIKKAIYMKSKLRTQMLKEQYIAADRNRKSNYAIMAKCSDQVEALKNCVSKREALISDLQNQCSKLGFAIQDQNYGLPTATSPVTSTKQVP